MRKFEVGDKVRLTAKAPRRVGDVGELREAFEDGSYDWHVHFDDGDWCAVDDSELELVEVEPARKFAVGDRVRLICVTMGIRSGTEGVVTGERDGGVIVRFDSHVWPTNGNDNGWWVLDSDIELIEAVDESSTPAHDHNDDSGVTRTIGAVVAGLTFAITGSEVTISNGGAIAAMTLAQFNEVHRILNEEAR